MSTDKEVEQSPRFTDGPWEYVETGPGANVAAGRFRIGQHWQGTASSEELRANARLIAAAPEMYEALREIANDPHNAYEANEGGTNASYGIGVTDGHRCAAQKARAVLERVDRGDVN